MTRGALALILCCLSAAAQSSVEALLNEGRLAYRKGDLAVAEGKLADAWSESEKGDPRDPLRYQVLKQQAVVASAGKKYVEAEGFLQLAVNWRERANGINDPGITDELSEIAMIVARAGDGERALTILRRVLGMHTRESHEAANDFNRMAQVHQMMKAPDQAATALQGALGIREKLLGQEHPGLLPDMDRLVIARLTLREYDKVETLCRRALAIREVAAGPDDPDLIQTLDALAYSLFGQKKYEEADPVYKRLLGLWLTSAGEMHPMVAVTLDKMAVFYREQEKWAEGKAAAEGATAVRANWLAAGLAKEAGFLVARKEYDKAEQLYRKALAVLSEPRAEHTQLREQIAASLKALEQAHPSKPAKGSRRSSSPGK